MELKELINNKEVFISLNKKLTNLQDQIAKSNKGRDFFIDFFTTIIPIFIHLIFFNINIFFLFTCLFTVCLFLGLVFPKDSPTEFLRKNVYYKLLSKNIVGNNVLINYYLEEYVYLNNKSVSKINDFYHTLTNEEIYILENYKQSDNIKLINYDSVLFSEISNYINETSKENLKSNMDFVFNSIDLLKSEHDQEQLVNCYLKNTQEGKYKSLLLNKVKSELSKTESLYTPNSVVKQI